MRFAVPQFIDVEDKIFGPLTIGQAIFLAGGVASAYLSFLWVGLVGLILFGFPILGFSIMFAFVKVNQRPFVVVLSAAFSYVTKHKLYLWEKKPRKKALEVKQKKKKEESVTPKISQSKLKALAFSLDTEDHFNK